MGQFKFTVQIALRLQHTNSSPFPATIFCPENELGHESRLIKVSNEYMEFESNQITKNL